MSENGEIYTAGKNFTLPPAVTALTNSTSFKEFKSSMRPRDQFRGHWGSMGEGGRGSQRVKRGHLGDPLQPLGWFDESSDDS